ncbi:hypothetical protein BTUL_0176g00290 [Botrytis tulipae]|uniref:Uncharacterized protein n=1 Tax=Botrytis tulipae TaxID=87230 RepID=A0A4Z1EER1_9HELO|nr:hypothetical protein BTUL_0176g00290 [Botrytis tulipae]
MNSESYNSQLKSEGGTPLTLERIAKMLEGQTKPEPPISKWFEDSHLRDIIYENDHRAHFTHRTPPYRGGNLDRGHGRGRSCNRSRGPGLLESFRSKGSQFAPRGGQQTAPYNPPQVN